MDGVAFTRELKGAPETAALPVIALTAHTVAKGEAGAGFTALVAKPWTPEELSREVRTALAGSESLPA
jgi:CheY-like chemotaxis protein